MHRTIFDTPGVNRILRRVSVTVLRLAGWRIEGALPGNARKCVLIAAPHTTNWDLPWTLMAAFALDLNIRWMGKASIFRWPFSGLMRWLGGLPVERSQAGNQVSAAAEALRAAEAPVQLVVAPEGTRSQVARWKTGFYYIAQGAGVPILMAYIDYPDRRAGLGPLFQPSGDLERDMAEIRAFYAPFRGRHPRQGPAA